MKGHAARGFSFLSGPNPRPSIPDPSPLKNMHTKSSSRLRFPYTQLIARREREAGVYANCIQRRHHAFVREFAPAGVILSAPQFVYEEETPRAP